MKTIVGVWTSLSWILSKSRVGVMSDIFLHLFIILTELSNFWMIHAICDAKQKSDLLLLCVFSGKKKKLKLRANSSRNNMIIVSLYRIGDVRLSLTMFCESTHLCKYLQTA